MEEGRCKDRQQKENELNNRFRMMDQLKRINSLEKQTQQEEKEMYRKELDNLMHSKLATKGPNDPSYRPHDRHNPITNPIDGHVDNPYFVKKIGNRLRL